MRTDSIYSKLQAHDAKAGTTYFLDLMIFLEEAEGDRFGKAASLVSDTFKFKTSKTALAVGYAAACSSWRLGRAREFAKATESLSTFDQERSQVIAQQAFQLLAQPNVDPKILLGFAKLEVERINADATVRRVKLLEDKAREAKKKLETVVKAKGGLSVAARKEIEEAAKLL